MLPRLLSADQDQILTALSNPYTIWSHLSSVDLMAFQYFLQVFMQIYPRLQLIQNHWQFLLELSKEMMIPVSEK